LSHRRWAPATASESSRQRTCRRQNACSAAGGEGAQVKIDGAPATVPVRVKVILSAVAVVAVTCSMPVRTDACSVAPVMPGTVTAVAAVVALP